MNNTTDLKEIKNISDDQWPSFCSSCAGVIESIYSVGVPSFIGELFDESFEFEQYNDTRIQRESSINKRKNVIETREHTKYPLLQDSNRNTSCPTEANNINVECKDPDNGDNIETEEALNDFPKIKRVKLSNDCDSHSYHAKHNNIFQNSKANCEEIRIIEEFRKECHNILNTRDVTRNNIKTLSQLGTNKEVVANQLPAFASVTILERRKTILDIANRLFNFTKSLSNADNVRFKRKIEVADQAPKN